MKPAPLGDITESDLARFNAKVKRTSECWVWTARLQDGYGRFRLNGRMVQAHRVAYAAEFGDPGDLDVDHLCRNHACVRPSHLEAVTRRVNILRGEGVAAQEARNRFCTNGHRYDKDLSRRRRACSTCLRERNRINQRRRREPRRVAA